MVADTDAGEAQGVEGVFGLLDLAEIFAGDGAAVLDAGGEAGAGGFVPELEAGLVGESADLGLGELGGDEWSDGVVLGGGLLAGAEVSAVVEVHAVGDVGEAFFCAELFHLGEELVFAVEAALGVVALVVGVFKLGGLEDVGGDMLIGGEGECGGELGAGERGGVGDYGEHFVAQSKVGGVGEVGGVGTAGVGDHDAAEVTEGGLEEGGFGGEIHLKRWYSEWKDVCEWLAFSGGRARPEWGRRWWECLRSVRR